MSNKVLQIAEGWTHQYSSFDPKQASEPHPIYLSRIIVMRARPEATVESIVGEYHQKMAWLEGYRQGHPQFEPILESVFGEDELVYCHLSVRAAAIMIKQAQEKHGEYCYDIRNLAEEAVYNRSVVEEDQARNGYLPGYTVPPPGPQDI